MTNSKNKRLANLIETSNVAYSVYLGSDCIAKNLRKWDAYRFIETNGMRVGRVTAYYPERSERESLDAIFTA